MNFPMPPARPEPAPLEPAEPNRFAGCETVNELVYRLVGAASTCWVGGTGAAVFDDRQAVRVADMAIDRLIELGWAPRQRESQVAEVLRREQLNVVSPAVAGVAQWCRD